VLSKLVASLKDPKLTWNVARSFGGWVRREAVSTSNPQLLHVCDEILCLPMRFSEYISWHDGQGNVTGRVFPEHPEAWDHTNETNPTTSAPYDGQVFGAVGYSGYLLVVDLTDGTVKTRVHIVKRSYPELQVLIFNKGVVPIKVNDPPATHGLSRYTTGTAEDGYVIIVQDQYVVYFKTTIPGVDIDKGVFSVSPLGSSKRYNYEAYYTSMNYMTLGFRLYTGIKAPKDLLLAGDTGMDILGGALNRGGINASSYVKGMTPVLRVYTSDPYCSQRTYDSAFPSVYGSVGWAEDDAGAVKFISISNTAWKHNTKWEKQGEYYTVVLYDSDIDEFFTIRYATFETNVTSYGRGGATILPTTDEAMFSPGTDAVLSRCVQYDDTLLEFTSPAPSTWTYYDCYSSMNCFDSPEPVCLATTALGIYTDDPNVSLPSDARNAFGTGGTTAKTVREGLQVKPFMDRTLYTGKVYAVVTRLKRFPRNVTANEYKAWATKKYPVVISADEWLELMSTPPFRSSFAGAEIPDGSTIEFTVEGTPAPGQTITVTGSCPQGRPGTVFAVLMDPDTYTAVAKSSAMTNSTGGFTVGVTIPSDAPNGKKYRLYIMCEP